MTIADRNKWDQKYASRQPPEDIRPDAWLVECCRELAPGRALDVACGLGHNAIWLAEQGWQVDAVDVSQRGLQLATESAGRRGARVNWICADLDEWTPQTGRYDLICVFRFLDRTRLPALISASLAPGGRLCYETFSAGQLDRSDNHLRSERFVLQPGELPLLYANLEVDRSDEVSTADGVFGRLLARKPGEMDRPPVP